MSTIPRTRALLAIDTVLEDLALAGITATADAGAFYPAPVGVLVGLPTLVERGLAHNIYTVPVLVVSADPLNSDSARDRIYALADDVALAIRCDNYRPSSWAGAVNAEPLPAIEMAETLGIPNGG